MNLFNLTDLSKTGNIYEFKFAILQPESNVFLCKNIQYTKYTGLWFILVRAYSLFLP